METLTVYPENKEQLDALTAVMKVMKVAFVAHEEPEVYPDHVIQGVKDALAEIQNGKGLLPFTSAKDMLNQE